MEPGLQALASDISKDHATRMDQANPRQTAPQVGVAHKRSAFCIIRGSQQARLLNEAGGTSLDTAPSANASVD